MIQILKNLFLGACAVTLLISCDKDEPDAPVIPNEEEVITTLRYTLTPVGGGDIAVFEFMDLDGDGGNDPVITGDTLMPNTEYSAVLTLLNELENPAGNIGEEVEEEGDAHQFFFSSSFSDILISYEDMDENGLPIGLNSQINTGEAASGSLNIVLRHNPDKNGVGVALGDITNAGGETDIEVTFDVEIQ